MKRFPCYKGRRSIVAIDATGLASVRFSSIAVNNNGQQPMSRRYWLKWLAVDVGRHLLLAQAAHAGPVNNCARLPALIEQARQHVSVHMVLADAEFDSERNHQHIRQQIGAHSVIPAKRGRLE